MRLLTALVGAVALIAAAVLVLGSCSSNKDRKPSATPAAQGKVTPAQVIIKEEELPGCKLDKQAESVIRAISQSFNCGANAAPDPRVTEFIAFIENSPDDASRILSNAWSTTDAATDIIRQQLTVRPIDPASIKVTNVKDAFGPSGAEQEYVWCATFSDGTTSASMYFGAFRWKNVRTEWTAFQTGGDCAGDSRARSLGKTLAGVQVSKLKTLLPAGSFAITATPGASGPPLTLPPTGQATPTRSP